MRCPKCETLIPHHAKFCPKCGEPSGRPASIDLPRAPDALPSKGPLPRQGKVFLMLLVLGIGLLGLGAAGRMTPLLYIGAAMVALMVLVLLVGDLIGL